LLEPGVRDDGDAWEAVAHVDGELVRAGWRLRARVCGPTGVDTALALSCLPSSARTQLLLGRFETRAQAQRAYDAATATQSAAGSPPHFSSGTRLTVRIDWTAVCAFGPCCAIMCARSFRGLPVCVLP
jgi:hypothetical protein